MLTHTQRRTIKAVAESDRPMINQQNYGWSILDDDERTLYHVKQRTVDALLGEGMAYVDEVDDTKTLKLTEAGVDFAAVDAVPAEPADDDEPESDAP